MKNFIIGQHGCYDEDKQQRDFRDGFFGVQGCLIEDEKDIKKLVSEAEKKNFKIAVHFPLRGGVFKFRDPLFLSPDDNARAEAFSSVVNELEYLRDIKPAFVLFHYPKPVILDDRVDWSQWRFGDSSEYVYESNYSFEELKERSRDLFRWLSIKSKQYGFTPVLEFDALNRYIYDSSFLEELLMEYPRVRLCLDTGRLHLQDAIDSSFNAEDIIRRFAKYTDVVHLWNVKVAEKVEYNHYPVLAWLDPGEGWGPIARYLELIRKENKACLMMFEHRSDLLSDEELDACYRWVDSLMK